MGQNKAQTQSILSDIFTFTNIYCLMGENQTPLGFLECILNDNLFPYFSFEYGFMVAQ